RVEHREKPPAATPVATPKSRTVSTSAPAHAAGAAKPAAKRKAKPRRGAATRYRYDDRRAYTAMVRQFMKSNPTEAERAEFFARARKFTISPPGSKARRSALMNLAPLAFRPPNPAPPKGLP